MIAALVLMVSSALWGYVYCASRVTKSIADAYRDMPQYSPEELEADRFAWGRLSMLMEMSEILFPRMYGKWLDSLVTRQAERQIEKENSAD